MTTKREQIFQEYQQFYDELIAYQPHLDVDADTNYYELQSWGDRIAKRARSIGITLGELEASLK